MARGKRPSRILVITVTGADDGVTVDVPAGKTGENDQPVSGDTTERVVYEGGACLGAAIPSRPT